MSGRNRGAGRRREERGMANDYRLASGAYQMDRRLVPRVREYLQQSKQGYKPDIEELVNHLTTRYHEYSRKKRWAFKLTVQKAYEVVSQQAAEDRFLQNLEEKFCQEGRNIPTYRNSKGNYDSAIDRGDNDKKNHEELSSDSEQSLEDEHNVGVQHKNMMNESMHKMYKLTKSQPYWEDERADKQAKNLTKQDKEMEDSALSQASQQGLDQNQTPGKGNSSLPIANTVSSDTATSAAPVEQTTAPVPAPPSELLSKCEGNTVCKRKRPSSAEKKDNIHTSTKSRKRLQNTRTGFDNTGNKEKPSGDPEFDPITSSVRFADIGGCDETLEQVCKLLVHMKHPEVFQTLGVTPPRGFLLHGPPGCGKTLLAHAIAGELEMPFLKLAATEIVSGVSGESEGKVRELFTRAVAHSPCVLFLDEIDAITPKRETASKDMERRIVSQLLTCMDDLNSNQNAQVLVIGATNRPDSLDPALRRAGRFDREISMGIPDEKARERILRVLCHKLKLEEEFSFTSLARFSPGFVGADLMALTREAALVAVNRIFQKLQKNLSSVDVIAATQDCAEQETAPCKDKEERDTSTTVSTPSVIQWLREQTPLRTEELEKLSICMADFKEALSLVQPSAKREGFATIPDVTWEDVGALKDVREELSMAILAPVKYPVEFQALGLTHPPGILLAGPPGCGKTLLAKAIANESGINFISVKGPELLNMYVGESERAVRQVFQRARNSAPCVIFFDELDALCPRRSGGVESSASVRVVNQLLTEMDGLVARKQVFIIGATNRPDIIDPAVMRPGRLDKVLYVGLPSSEDREDILGTLTKNGQKPHLLPDVNIRELALDERCQGFSGADLAALVREASMAALRESIVVHPACSLSLENRPQPATESPVGVGQRHFAVAFQKVKPSVSKKDQVMYEQMKASSRE